MKFSTRDRYALRLMVELANHGDTLVPLKEISDTQQISLKYLEQIITPLAKPSIMVSVRSLISRARKTPAEPSAVTPSPRRVRCGARRSWCGGRFCRNCRRTTRQLRNGHGSTSFVLRSPSC